MFIFLQSRTDIIGSLAIKTLHRDEENKIYAVLEWATDTQPEKSLLLGEYNNDVDAKNVMKLLFDDMKRREFVFKMPKKDAVAKMLKIAVERKAAAKKAAAEREARRIEAEKLAEEKRKAKEAKAAAHEKLLAEQAAAKAKRVAARAAAAAEEAPAPVTPAPAPAPAPAEEA